MKICYIAPLGSTHVERWVNYFADAGHEVHLFVTYGDKHSANFCNNMCNVKLYILNDGDNQKRIKHNFRIPTFLYNLIHGIIQINKLIEKIEPDIVHAHWLCEGMLIGLSRKIHPFVVTAWGSDVLIAPKKSKVVRWFVKSTLKRADLITCDAEHIQKPLIQLGANPKKISLICFGTDTQKFKPRQRDKNLREALGILDSPAIISLRRLSQIYDIESLIAAIPIVLKEFSGVKFVIAGTGPLEVKLKELAKSLGVWDSVKFVGWIPNDDELSRYLASVDVYVSTSLSDAGLAASTAEAMACGLPVVITDFGDNRKWIEDGVNGFIVPLKNPKALAEKIIYLLKNKDARMVFGMRNRKIIEERNNYYKEMEKMENIYIELVERYKS
jgi:glycosyltransferase involved in cell wall biosynthesis